MDACLRLVLFCFVLVYLLRSEFHVLCCVAHSVQSSLCQSPTSRLLSRSLKADIGISIDLCSQSASPCAG
jgi:hypothetical protein